MLVIQNVFQFVKLKKVRTAARVVIIDDFD